MTLLSLIIVNWNTCALLAACLTAVEAELANFPGDQVETWVIDNASTDGSVGLVQTRFPWVRLLKNRVNLGFASANNQAMQVARGRYFFLLNADTELLPGALPTLVQFMEAHPQAAAAGARYLNPDGSLQMSCYPAPTLVREGWRMFHLDRLYPFGVYPMAAWCVQTPRTVDVVQGAALLLRRTVLDQIGRFDTSYFMYTEEVDLCQRMRQAGWSIYFVPTACIMHHGGQSTRQAALTMFLQLYRSKILYFRKHHGITATFLYKVMLFCATIMRLGLTPLVWLEAAPRRRHHLTVANHYRHLALTLPTM